MAANELAPTKPLLTIQEAAELLGVPAAPLRRAAEWHGYLIMFGRAARLRRDELDALVECCRPKLPGRREPFRVSPPSPFGDDASRKAQAPSEDLSRTIDRLIEEGKKRRRS